MRMSVRNLEDGQHHAVHEISRPVVVLEVVEARVAEVRGKAGAASSVIHERGVDRMQIEKRDRILEPHQVRVLEEHVEARAVGDVDRSHLQTFRNLM